MPSRTPALPVLLIAMVCLVAPHPGAARDTNPARTQRIPAAQSREAGTQVATATNYQVTLTYPAGQSPKVFTKGWVFGAQGTANPGTKQESDISQNVRWKGTGTFNPDRGPMSRPTFNGPGTNRIILYVEQEGRVVFEKTFTVQAVDPQNYARLGGIAQCPNHGHGCPACPHPTMGPITDGSKNVSIDGMPAARVGDPGVHTLAACCGPNTFVITTGDPNVLIDGKPAARVGDQTLHCGEGIGKIVSAHRPP